MKHKILSLILVAAMLLNIGATSVFATDGSTSPAQEGGTTIDASGDVDPACICGGGEGETHAEDCPQYTASDEPESTEPVCTCEAGEGEAHAEDCPQYTASDEPEQPAEPVCTCEAGESEAHAGDCPQYTAPDEPEQSTDLACPCEAGEGEAHTEGCVLYETPVEPVCTCETKCAEDAINAECEVCAADLAACAGESAADPAVAAVRELIAALPDAEALGKMSTEEQNQVYDALLAADEAYQALNEEQKGQLAEENVKLDALFAYFSSPNMAAPAAIPTVESYDIYANGTPLLIVAYGEGTAIYIDTNGNGQKDSGELSLQEAGVVDENNKFHDGSASYKYSIIYGGSKDDTVASTRITMSGGTVESIYGGSGTGGSVTGNTEVIINGGAVRASVYGGGYESSVGGKASVTVSGGTVGFAFNGHGVFGGGDEDGSVTDSTEVTITGGTVGYRGDSYGDVCGGGDDGGSVTGKAKVTITGVTMEYIYGGGDSGSVGSTEVLIDTSGTVTGDVYGGQYWGGSVGKASVTIKGTVNGNVYGGSGVYGGSVGSTEILIDTGGTVAGNVYGGGKRGTVGSAHVKCENGGAGKIIFDAGISRTASDGDFQSATAGETTPQGYFEYLSANHYTASAIADPEKHAIICADGNCSLKLTDTTAPHSWNAEDSCDECGYTLYNVWVGGVQVGGVPDTNGNITVTGGTITGTVTFTPAGDTVDDPDTSVLENAPTLTLDDASITAAATPVDVDYGYTPPCGIYSRSALNLVLTGANTITASTTDYSAGVMADVVDLTISGGGSLKINTCGYGINALKLVTNGVIIEIIDSVYAISLGAGGTIEESTVSAVGSDKGISTTYGMIKIDNSSVYAKGGTYSFHGTLEGVSVSLVGAAHVKAEGAINTNIGVSSDGSGYLRGISDDTFTLKPSGNLEYSGTYFEYVGEGHYKFSPVAGSEAHAIICTDTSCGLQLTDATALHRWNTNAGGATCGVCKANAAASVTAGGTTAYYYGIDNAVANWTDGATLTLLADVTDLTGGITTTGKGLVLDLNGHTLASKISIEDTSELTIRDSNGSGCIEGTVYANAGVYSKSALRLESGTVKMVMANGDFTMTGGSIKNEDGDGLYSNGGNNNIVISGGEIYGGETGIWLTYSSNLTITGTAKITGANEYAIRNGSGVVISGTPTISGSQCEFSLGGKITLNTQNTQPASGKTWRVKIDTAKIADGVFAIPGEGVILDSAWFTSATTGYVVVKDGDNLKLAKGITEDMVTVTESATYSGSQQNPAVTVTWTDGSVLTEGQHYAVGCKDNKGDWVFPTDADTYTVVITGMNGYAGEVEKTYTINPKSLEDATVTAPNQTYTGSKLTPAVAVTLTGYTITSDDYDVSYSPDTLTDAGSYTITVTGKGNFTGEATGDFTIDPASIASATVTALAQTYDGTEKEPEPTVTLTLGGAAKTLVKDTDYTVTGYGDNTDVGTATINITGIGNYKDTATGTFAINKATPKAADFEFTPPSNLIYDGTSKTAAVAAESGITGMGAVTVSYYQGGTAITGEPVNAGTYTVRIGVTEGDNYLAASGITDSAWTFTIEKADLTITAKAQTIKYGESIAAGTGQVEVSGLAANETLSEITLTPGIQDAGTGNITPSAAKIDPSESNYNISYTPGTLTIDKAAALTLRGEMNVANKLEHSYTFDLSTIVPGNHGAWGSDSAVEYELDNVNITTGGYYDGNNPPASVSGQILTLPIQEVDSDAETSIGTVTVTIKSQNYEDSTLEITVNSTNKQPVEIAGVTAQNGTYNGSAWQGYTGTPTSAFGATGYEITYTGRGSTGYDSAAAPTDAGDYTVTFKVPDSNPAYMGTGSLDFSIAPRPLSWNTGSVTIWQAYVPGKVDVENTSSITNTSVTLSGVISTDDVNWTGAVQSAEFADDDIGENKTVTVTISGLILTGTDAANYAAPAATFTITGAITEPKTNGSGMLGMLDGDLIISRDELPTDAGMDEVYGAAAATALRAKFGSTNVMESVQTALKEAAAKTAGANASNMNHKVLEIFLEYYDATDQKWVRITEDNLDDVKSKIPGGVPVTIPFDLLGSHMNSSNYSSYDFLLHHMITLPLDHANVGDIEQLPVTVDASGLHTTVENGFSPFVISYAGKPTGSSGGSSSGSSGNSSSDNGSSGGSATAYKDGEYDFWMGVKAQIEAAKDGTTLRVSAGDYTRMPIEVMNALRARSNVTLNITWNGGIDINIPSDLAPTPENDRVYYELSELAAVFPEKAAETPDRETDTATEEEAPAPKSPATGDTDAGTDEPEGEEITTEEGTSEGAAPETEEMIPEETGKEETKEGCIWHWLMLLFMLAYVLFIVIGERKPFKTTLIALGVDAALTVIVMIAGSCSLDIPFAIGALLMAGASIPVKNMISGKDTEEAEE